MALTTLLIDGIETVREAFDKVNTIVSELLSVANGKGASQIGVEDSADYFTATNVENALKELYENTIVYFGVPTTDGSWRITKTGDDLAFERRESSTWVEKGRFTA